MSPSLWVARGGAIAWAVASTLGAVIVGCGSRGTPRGFPTESDGYDVVVVGAGAGGGTLAARLARAGKSVLLLEAGGDVGNDAAYQVPARHALASEDPTRAWSYFVQHHADATLDARDSKYVAAEHGILYPRGSALGGSTAVNAMVTVLPSPSDWDRLAEITGEASFRASAMTPFVARVREWLPEELADVTLAVGDPVISGFLSAAARVSGQDGASNAVDTGSSLAQLLGPSLNASLANGETTGLFRLPFATSHGHRRGARERIVETVDAGFPLTVRTHALVTKVIFDRTVTPPRAIGVEYRSGADLYSASARHVDGPLAPAARTLGREVVLAAGAFNTPALLQLSGVGDPALLAELGIPKVVARPGVGRNLQDRYEASVVAEMDTPIPLVAPCRMGEAGDPCQQEWNAGRGVYQTPGFLATILERSSPSSPVADLQIFAVPTDARGYYPGYSRDAARAKSRFSWLILKAHAKNRSGFVAVTSADPTARPHIQTNVFEGAGASDDLAAMVRGVREVRGIHDELRRSQPDLGFHEIWPGPTKQSDQEIAQFIKDETWGHHVCCTDAMGRADDAAAVVDAHFRVIGASNLRVVDASVFPEIPGTFIALPLYVLAERAAQTMIEDLP